jgi:tetratricopeptide (TPR) repeat protein
MSFLKKIFGKTGQISEQTVNTEIERFQKEFLETVPRYVSTPKASIDLRARHRETNEVIPFAIAFSEQFETWKTVKSLADRRGIIYSILDNSIGNQLKIWQVIERFIDDRYPEKALSIAINNRTEEDLHSADYWASVAKVNFVLTNYSEAETNALKALEIEKIHKRAKIVLADIYHFTNKIKEAHEIYNSILKELLPKDKEVDLPIVELLGFDGNILNSPIYASSWLKADKNMNEETWNWAGEEFYYSPHFRSQHAYHLIEKKEHLKGFVKLLNLTKEMPWFKESVINSYNLIGQLNMEDRMQEEKIRLKSIIDKNNWTMDNLHTFMI